MYGLFIRFSSWIYYVLYLKPNISLLSSGVNKPIWNAEISKKKKKKKTITEQLYQHCHLNLCIGLILLSLLTVSFWNFLYVQLLEYHNMTKLRQLNVLKQFTSYNPSAHFSWEATGSLTDGTQQHNKQKSMCVSSFTYSWLWTQSSAYISLSFFLIFFQFLENTYILENGRQKGRVTQVLLIPQISDSDTNLRK